MNSFSTLARSVAALTLLASSLCAAELLTVTRATDLKQDRFLDAPAVASLNAGQQVELIKSEAGWVQVKNGKDKGWLRAMYLKSDSGPAVASIASIEGGRSGKNNTMSTTGVRSLPKASRHALIIGIGEYTLPGVSPLKGVSKDMTSAKDIAMAMSVPESNIQFLRDKNATAEQIRTALKDMDERVKPGDRVFIYYSGHGTRWVDTQTDANACTEGLLASDGVALTNRQVSELITPIANKADKLMVFYDACHSGGVANQPMKTRSLKLAGDTLSPKFVPQVSPELCATPSNMKTRSLTGELAKASTPPPAKNMVYIAASRADEVSFDNPNRGGLATTAWRECMLGAAKDSDSSGALSVEEIASCAQSEISKMLANSPDILGQHMTIAGNRDFVPSYFAQGTQVASLSLDVALPASTPPTTPTATQASATSASNVATESLEPALPQPSSKPVVPAELLRQIHEQRDASRSLNATASPKVMRIGQDQLHMSITSPRDGYLYIALAGSDGKSLYLLYPNTLDTNNAVKANQKIDLPTSRWRITAGGPVGVDTMLVMVTDSPRDLSRLQGDKVGPFLKTLMSTDGKSQLQWLLSTSENSDDKSCQIGGTKRNLNVSQACSDAFASSLLSVEEK
ncbi:hypothetical protein B9Z35_06030 [Limnohabitans sp. Jir61]|uniref:caspase family protein n=1 Tax=Limnohabitans sp. Jir61 TaxID=1826168 RepID=UPI000D39077A|nr:caspase family protein [Limnohabitans sp. Jir61]PUE33077.1 hypothetical protein B9Z35_06030 [Limnohabitans sp. Jir61]